MFPKQMQDIFANSEVFYGSHLVLTCLMAFAAPHRKLAVVAEPWEQKAELGPWDGLATTRSGAVVKHWERTDIIMGKHKAHALLPSSPVGLKGSLCNSRSSHSHLCVLIASFAFLHGSGAKLI